MSRINQRGVTIVELLIVMIVSGLLMGLITRFALNYWSRTTFLEASQETLVSRLNSGDYLRDSIDGAAGMINQNDLPDAHVGKLDPADNSQTHWLPIHAIPGTTNVGTTGTITPLIYYDRPSINTSKNIVLNGTIPYHDVIVLYLNGTTKQLRARTIANSAVTNNRVRTSCPAAQATSGCPADAVVAEDVSSVGMRYFSRSGNTIDYTSITDPTTGAYIGPDFPSVEVVEFTIKFYRKASIHNSTNTLNQTVIRVALRNY